MQDIYNRIIDDIEDGNSIVTGVLYNDTIRLSYLYNHFNSFRNIPDGVSNDLERYFTAIEKYENYVKKETNEFIRYNEEEWDHVPWHDYDNEPSNNLETMKIKFMELAYKEGVCRFMVKTNGKKIIELEGLPEFTKKYEKTFNNIGKKIITTNIHFTDVSKYQSVDFDFDTFFNFYDYDDRFKTGINF